MAALDRLERLTDLVLVLLNARSPRTLEQIAAAVPGYPTSPGARRQAFERDKRILRDEGIPVVTEPIEGPEQYGYRIDPDVFYLPDLDLTVDEQAALHLAVAGVSLGDPSGRDALAKLGASGVADARPVAQMDAPRALVELFDAVRSQAEVRFTYHARARAVAPASLQFRAGRWYLVGWERASDALRTYRVDRIESLGPSGPPGSGVVPERDAARDAALDPWRDDGEAEHVQVRVDAVEGPRVVAEVGERAVCDRASDGSVLLDLGVSSFQLLRSWVLGLLDHAEVVGPPEARAAIVSWLREIAAPRSPAAAGAPAERGEEGSDLGSAMRAAPASRSQGARASARLRRLLAIVALLAEAGEASIAELAGRFDMAPEEVVHELELAACCGVPPYSPDTLLEIVVTGAKVQAFLPKELARPRRLTPAEGLALAAAARTILSVPGADADGALARALQKLETVIGDHRRLVVRIDAAPLLEEARALAVGGVQAEIVYHSASTDETTERVVEPLDVVSLDGHWYLDAYCHRAQGVRRFRLDRIRELRPLGTPVTARPALRSGAEAFVPGPGAEAVTVQLDGDARWVADSVPVLDVRQGPGSAVEVTLAVGGRAWLERLLLQAGPRARVVAPPDLEGVGREAASRLLRTRYAPAAYPEAKGGSMKMHEEI
ncbi:MAG: helix-turn-helix transcriptional regulator [Acidimicrobiales bacterium]